MTIFTGLMSGVLKESRLTQIVICLAILSAACEAKGAEGPVVVVRPVGATTLSDVWSLPAAYDGSGLLSEGALSVETGDTVPAVWPSHGDGMEGPDSWGLGIPVTPPVWVLFDLGQTYSLKGMRLWNLNTSWSTGSGIKNATVTVSTDGVSYTPVTVQGLDGNGCFYKAPGTATGFTGVTYSFSGAARYVKLAITSDWDEMMESMGVGLSEIRFIAEAAPSGTLVSGVVLDVAGVPVAGVSMATNGTSAAAVTDVNGIYSLAVAPGFSGTLTVSKADHVFIPAQVQLLDVRTPVEANFRAVPGGIAPRLALGSNDCSWAGIAGVVYQPQWSDDLIQWHNYGVPMEGSDPTALFTFRMGETNCMFFRLQAESVACETVHIATGEPGQEIESPLAGVSLLLPEGLTGTLAVTPLTGILDARIAGLEGFEFTPSEPGRVLIRVPKVDGEEPELYLWQIPQGFVDGFAYGVRAWLPVPPLLSDATSVTYELGYEAAPPEVQNLSRSGETYVRPLRNYTETFDTYKIALRRANVEDAAQRARQQQMESRVASKLTEILAKLSEPMRDYALSRINGNLKYRVFIGWLDIIIQSDNDGNAYMPFTRFTNTLSPTFHFNAGTTDYDITHEIGHYLNHVFTSDTKFRALRDTAPQSHGLGQLIEPRQTVIEEYAYFVEYAMGFNRTAEHGNYTFKQLNQDIGGTAVTYKPHESKPSLHDFPSAEGFGLALMAGLCSQSEMDFTGVKTNCPVAINMPKEKVFMLFASGAKTIDELRVAINDLLTPGERTRFQVIAEQMGWSYRGTGHIVDPDGVPVSNAVVSCYVETDVGDIMTSSTTSDAGGEFTLKRVAPGPVKLKVVTGYDPAHPVFAGRTNAWENLTPTLINLDTNSEGVVRGIVVPGPRKVGPSTITVDAVAGFGTLTAPNGGVGRILYQLGYSVNSSDGIQALGNHTYRVPTNSIVNVSFSVSGQALYMGPTSLFPSSTLWFPDSGSNDEGYQYVFNFPANNGHIPGASLMFDMEGAGSVFSSSVNFPGVTAPCSAIAYPSAEAFVDQSYLNGDGAIMINTIGYQTIHFNGVTVHIVPE